MGKRKAARSKTTATPAKKTKAAATKKTTKAPAKKATAKAKAAPAPAPAPVPAPAPAPAPAPTPAPPASSPSKSNKKELSDEIKKMFRSLAAKVTTKTKITTADLNECTVNDLKLVLKLNDRSTTGNRGDLCKNVVDYIQNGCPPRCPECGGGRLRFKPGKGGGSYHCPGYMEDDEFINCGFKGDDSTVTRVAWISP